MFGDNEINRQEKTSKPLEKVQQKKAVRTKIFYRFQPVSWKMLIVGFAISGGLFQGANLILAIPGIFLLFSFGEYGGLAIAALAIRYPILLVVGATVPFLIANTIALIIVRKKDVNLRRGVAAGYLLVFLSFFSVFSPVYEIKTAFNTMQDSYKGPELGDETICEKLRVVNETSLVDQMNCFLGVAKKKKDVALCERIPDGTTEWAIGMSFETKNDCYYSIAGSTNNLLLCDKVTDYRRQYCESGIQSNLTIQKRMEDAGVSPAEVDADLANGVVAPFDACHPISFYKDKSWFNTMKNLLKNDFDTIGDSAISEGCLSRDYFIFIIPSVKRKDSKNIMSSVYSFSIWSEKLDRAGTLYHPEQFLVNSFGARQNEKIPLIDAKGCTVADYFILRNMYDMRLPPCK